MSDVNLPDKWAKLIKKMPEWASAAESKNTEELEREVLKQQGVITDMEFEMANDAKLIAVTEELKILRKDYRDTIAEAQARSAYCLYLLRSRGKKVKGDA